MKKQNITFELDKQLSNKNQDAIIDILKHEEAENIVIDYDLTLSNIQKNLRDLNIKIEEIKNGLDK